MLSLIRAKNYAVIDEVEVEFAAGFSVVTGETGAGKSILVDALGLALGAIALRGTDWPAQLLVSMAVARMAGSRYLPVMPGS